MTATKRFVALEAARMYFNRHGVMPAPFRVLFDDDTEESVVATSFPQGPSFTLRWDRPMEVNFDGVRGVLETLIPFPPKPERDDFFRLLNLNTERLTGERE